MIQRLTRAAVALALLGVPLAPLYCGGDDAAAAMACCRERPDECNQPTAQDDDCCRDTPSGRFTTTALGWIGVTPLAKIQSAAPSGREALLPIGADWACLTVHHRIAEYPPNSLRPPLSVLRI